METNGCIEGRKMCSAIKLLEMFCYLTIFIDSVSLGLVDIQSMGVTEYMSQDNVIAIKKKRKFFVTVFWQL